MAHLSLIVPCLLTLAATTALAQEPTPRYQPIPFQGNFEAQFKERLQTAKDIERLQKLFQQFQQHQGFDLDLLKQFKLDDPAGIDRLKEDPAVKEIIQSLKEKRQKGDLFSQEDLEKLTKTLDRHASNPRPSAPAPNQQINPGQAAQAAKPRQELLDQWLREWLRNVDEASLADWLSDSPALRQGIEDLKEWMNRGDNPISWGLDTLPNWSLPDQLNLNLPDGFLTGLNNLSLPDLPRVDLPRINLGAWNPPNISVPNLGVPRGRGLGELLLWTAVIAVSLILLWQLAKKIGLDRKTVKAPAELGPWPVDPAHIVTRAQLVKAFDYLAILRLGGQVRTWNHRAIAGQMSAATHQGGAVEELTQLYELARYTEGTDTLTDREQSLARRHVSLLARVPGS